MANLGRRTRRAAAAHREVSPSGDELSVRDPVCFQQVVQELAEARPAARLLQAAAIDHRLAISETDGIIAHELRQPLFAIGMASENLRLLLDCDEIDRDRMRTSVKRIAEQIERAQAIIEHTLLRASRQAHGDASAPEPPHGPLPGTASANMAQAVHRAVDLLESMAVERDIVVTSQLPSTHLLAGLPAIELEQVLVNVIRNALESIGDRREGGWSGQGRIAITLQRSAGDLRCRVTDNGVGLPEGHAVTLFRPFYTTKPKGGTGLGLHICREIVGKAGGTIQARTLTTGGAEIEIRVPCVQDTSSAQ